MSKTPIVKWVFSKSQDHWLSLLKLDTPILWISCERLTMVEGREWRSSDSGLPESTLLMHRYDLYWLSESRWGMRRTPLVIQFRSTQWTWSILKHLQQTHVSSCTSMCYLRTSHYVGKFVSGILSWFAKGSLRFQSTRSDASDNRHHPEIPFDRGLAHA